MSILKICYFLYCQNHFVLTKLRYVTLLEATVSSNVKQVAFKDIDISKNSALVKPLVNNMYLEKEQIKYLVNAHIEYR